MSFTQSTGKVIESNLPIPSRWRMTAVAIAMLLIAALGSPDRARAAERPRNVVFVLIDDMRYDVMSFMGHPLVKTPALDSLAAGGVHFRNAFVTTSLCSPSRASILTGLYAHRHNILNNVTPLKGGIPTFPEMLQRSGYRTAFVGKWHMGGDSDEPRPGFDYWASFRGQGLYFDNDFNINGERVKVPEYVTDAITRMSLDWVKANHDKPFMLYMSHKASHDAFIPAPRHKDTLAGTKVPFPASMEDTPDNYWRKPRWVREQRCSWHGVDDAYHKSRDRTLEEIVRDYYATIFAIDDSVGALVQTLKELNLFDSTLIIFMSDNGFMWGEHGLVDKRTMYEESIRVPMIASCPELYGTAGRTVDAMVLNLDIAPTIIEAAGLSVPESMQGRSFLNLPVKPDMEWRKAWLYEYFWEVEYPETPACLGIRTDQYKLIRYHGIFDANEMYDVQNDPHDMRNLIMTSRRKVVTPDAGYEQVYKDLNRQLDRLIDETGARKLPVWSK